MILCQSLHFSGPRSLPGKIRPGEGPGTTDALPPFRQPLPSSFAWEAWASAHAAGKLGTTHPALACEPQ